VSFLKREWLWSDIFTRPFYNAQRHLKRHNVCRVVPQTNGWDVLPCFLEWGGWRRARISQNANLATITVKKQHSADYQGLCLWRGGSCGSWLKRRPITLYC